MTRTWLIRTYVIVDSEPSNKHQVLDCAKAVCQESLVKMLHCGKIIPEWVCAVCIRTVEPNRPDGQYYECPEQIMLCPLVIP